jgi:hypothetical protein
MDDILRQPNSSHSKTSLPTFARSIPLEIAALPASTRTSFTRVDDTRPGTAAGDIPNNHNHLPDDPVSGTGTGDGNGRGGGGGDGADARSAPPPPEGEQEEEEETGAVVPQVPQTLVQFLLVSGRRRSMAFDPETTVGRVKELVWNTWPNGTLSFALAPPPPTHVHMHIAARLRAIWYTKCAAPAAAATRPDSILNFNFYSFILYSFYFY